MSILITLSSFIGPLKREGRTKDVVQVLIASTYDYIWNACLRIIDELDAYLFIYAMCYNYYMSDFIHATPIYPSPCLWCFQLWCSLWLLLLSLLLNHCCHYITVATNKSCQASISPCVVELTTKLLRLIGILWLPLY